jgi:hypothetical protein
MFRFSIALLVAMATSMPAMSADRAVARHGWHRAAVLLPPGLPRPHYNFRTTISYGAPYSYRRAYAPPYGAFETPELLFTPVYPEVPYVTPWVGAPLLPGSATLPGYYGWAYSDEYQGPYDGGPYVGYWDRLPYACGVYGYC